LKAKRALTRLAALFGIFGPGLFGLVLASLTLLDYNFLRSLGWDPFSAPTLDWPSGLALGPHAGLMTATFLFSGASLSFFALGLRNKLSTGRLGIILMTLAGLALMGLAFSTDPTLRTTPPTWHGRLHDLSFVLLGLALMPGMLALGLAFRHEPRWANLTIYTLGTASLALPAFFIKGPAFYVFLAAILAWCEVIALRLWNLSRL
jgi:hypothetical protein